jgi:predicted enzyme related to lactoylglutathione lyase
MTVTVAQVVIDCEDAARLAAFWAEVLGRPVDDGASPFFATVRGGSPALMFLKVEEPKRGKNRVHLDLTAADWRAEVKRVVDLGATFVAEFAEYGTEWATLRDPEGNEFDLGAAHDQDAPPGAGAPG